MKDTNPDKDLAQSFIYMYYACLKNESLNINPQFKNCETYLKKANYFSTKYFDSKDQKN